MGQTCGRYHKHATQLQYNACQCERELPMGGGVVDFVINKPHSTPKTIEILNTTHTCLGSVARSARKRSQCREIKRDKAPSTTTPRPWTRRGKQHAVHAIAPASGTRAPVEVRKKHELLIRLAAHQATNPTSRRSPAHSLSQKKGFLMALSVGLFPTGFERCIKMYILLNGVKLNVPFQRPVVKMCIYLPAWSAFSTSFGFGWRLRRSFFFFVFVWFSESMCHLEINYASRGAVKRKQSLCCARWVSEKGEKSLLRLED